jgi:hypothetical protein
MYEVRYQRVRCVYWTQGKYALAGLLGSRIRWNSTESSWTVSGVFGTTGQRITLKRMKTTYPFGLHSWTVGKVSFYKTRIPFTEIDVDLKTAGRMQPGDGHGAADFQPTAAAPDSLQPRQLQLQ